ncbi:hypothetical protein OAP63_14100 [Vibrio sp.]|nr:hypothetical protein [Vibrio sp.]
MNTLLFIAFIAILAVKLSIKKRIVALCAVAIFALYLTTHLDMLPSLVILYLITPLLLTIRESRYLRYSYGLAICVPVGVSLLLHSV